MLYNTRRRCLQCFIFGWVRHPLVLSHFKNLFQKLLFTDFCFQQKLLFMLCMAYLHIFYFNKIFFHIKGWSPNYTMYSNSASKRLLWACATLSNIACMSVEGEWPALLCTAQAWAQVSAVQWTIVLNIHLTPKTAIRQSKLYQTSCILAM